MTLLQVTMTMTVNVSTDRYEKLRKAKRNYAARHLLASVCANCRESDPRTLTHVLPDGEPSVALLASRLVAWGDFKDAVHRAQVLCRNCVAKVGSYSGSVN